MTAPTIIDQQMPQPEPIEPRHRGLQAVIGAVTGIAGLVLAIHPENPIAQAMSRALPTLGDALPAVIGACGTIVAAFSHPPTVQRNP